MADETAPFLEISDLVVRLQRLRDWAERSGPPEIFVDLVEACVICEALADPDGDWSKTVSAEDLAAKLRRQGLHLVPGNRAGDKV